MSQENKSRMLTPVNLDAVLDPNKKPDLSHLPHLDWLSALVFVFMQAIDKMDEQFEKWFSASREQDTSLAEILKKEEFKALWPLSQIQTPAELPELMAQKIQEAGNPFGFSPGATRAAIEMAHELSSNQMQADDIRMNVIGFHELDPTSYFQETMFQMYHYGYQVGAGGLSHAKFPAYMYWGELFPPDVIMQIKALEKSPRHTDNPS